MIANLICAGAILGQSGPSASKIVGEVFQKYASAKSVSGTIILKQSIGQQAGALTTDLALVRPNKLRIVQKRQTQRPKTWIVIADGDRFTYEEPYSASLTGQPKQLIESMKPKAKKAFSLMDVYSAASHSIGDRSTPLDIAIGRPEDLKYLTYQWATMKVINEVDYNGTKCDVIKGDWRQYGDAPVTGRFTLYATKDRQLKFFAIEELLRLNNADQLVVSSWQVDLTLDEPLKDSLFQIR